jgi:hypothetical protein
MSLWPSVSPSENLPTQVPLSPTEQDYLCFANREELKIAVDQYVQAGCGVGINFCPPIITSKYGWPMNSWCVDVTDMSCLFKNLKTFNEGM